MRRAGGVGLLLLALSSIAAPASAGLKIDLAKIVVDDVPGYVTVPGVGINGPLSKEQFISLSTDPARVRAKLKGRFVRIYAHTFVRQDRALAIVIGFQFDRPAASKGFVSGVRESTAAKGPVTPVPGTDARYTGDSGRPLPAVSWPVTVHPLKSVPRKPSSNAPPPMPIPVVYWT